MFIVLPILLVLIVSAFLFRKIYYSIKFFTKNKRIIIFLTITIALLILIPACYIYSLYFVWFIYFLLFLIISKLIYHIFNRVKNHKIIDIIYHSLMVPTLLSLCFVIYGYYNMNNVVKTEYTLNTTNNINNYKIVFISDMHYGNSINSQKLIKIVDNINADDPDIVILGGDIVDEKTTKKELYEVFNILSTINNKYGIYYINGNHDFNQYVKNKNYTKEELLKTINNNGIKLLIDDIKTINNDLLLIGRDDKSNEFRKSILELTKGLDKNKFIISLDHSPNDYESTKASDVKLIISGHTHAGQLWPLEIFTALTNDLSYGYKKDGNFNMIVSSGISGWGFKARTSRNSEYVLINIQ